MPKIRTLSETYKYLIENDPDTAISKNALRQMVLTGKIPCIRAGKKYLIDVDRLMDYLSGKIENPTPKDDKNKFKFIPKLD